MRSWVGCVSIARRGGYISQKKNELGRGMEAGMCLEGVERASRSVWLEYRGFVRQHDQQEQERPAAKEAVMQEGRSLSCY